METVTPPPSMTESFVASAKTQKHYSFLRPLECVSATGDFGFGPYLNGQIVDDKFKRLSASLHALVDQGHGLKHLPEMPLPDYDNGTINQPLEHIKCSGTQPRSDNQFYRSNLKPLPQMNLGKPFEFASESETQPISRLIQSPRHNKRKSRDISKHCSSSQGRPNSMYSTSTIKHVSYTRMGSDGNSSKDASTPRKKSITFDEQRYTRPSREAKQIISAQSLKKKLRFIPNLMDMHMFERRQVADDFVLTDRQSKGASLLSFQEALQQNLSTLPQLHDIEEDRKFTDECTQFLRNQSQCSFITSPPRQVTVDPRKRDEILASMNMQHTYRLSEASLPSVSDSILDIEWPQPSVKRPGTTETRMSQQFARRDSDTIPLCENIMLQHAIQTGKFPDSQETCIPSLWRENSMSKHSPSSPPQRPLPPLPRANIAAISDETLTISNIFPCNGSPRKFDVQDNCIVDVSTYFRDCDVREIQPAPLSPLKGRFTSSRRSERVNEIRKKHISMLMKDNARLHEKMLHVDPSDRRGSAPTQLYRSLTQASMKYTRPGTCTECDYDFKPAITGSLTNHRRVTSNTSSRKGHRTSTDIRVRKRSNRNSRVVFPHVVNSQNQRLAQSSIMTLVDSEPNMTHGFSAGTISPRRTRNRKQLKISVSEAVNYSFDPDGSNSSARSSTRSWLSFAKSEMTELTISSAHTSADVSLVGKFRDGTSTEALTQVIIHPVPSVPIFSTQWADKSSLEQEFVPANELKVSSPVSDPDRKQTKSTIEELQIEMDRIRRVYSDMSKVNQERSGNGKAHLRFSELLTADRSNTSTSTGSSPLISDGCLDRIQKQLENDLLSSPQPSQQAKLLHISLMQRRSRPSTPEGEDSVSVSLATSRFHPSLISRKEHYSVGCEGRPVSSNSVTRTSPRSHRPSPSSDAKPSSNKKRYSILSQYNPYPTPESSPRITSAQWGPFPYVRDSLGRSQNNHNFIFSQESSDIIHEEVVTMPSITTTRMETAIDVFNFTTPTRRELDILSASRQEESSPLFTDFQWGSDLEETTSQYEQRTGCIV